MDEHDDRYDVAGMSDRPTASPVREPSASLVPAIAAGLVAAVVGGVAWALIVKWSEYEIGIVAWAIGFIVGTAVVRATRGAKGPPLQVIAVALALVGILIGKYLSYALVVQEELDRIGESVGLFSSDMFSFFREDLDAVFGLFDVLWIGLAVFTAWRIPQLEVPEEAAGDRERETL